jgi:hypothetical protein
MTDDAPTFIHIDQTWELATAHLTRIYLEGLADAARQAAEDAEEDDPDMGPPELPVLDSDDLREYLADLLEVENSVTPMIAALKGGLIAVTVISMLNAQAKLDVALMDFLGGDGLVSPSNLYVNDPNVMQALEGRPLGPNEVMLLPFGDFYEVEQLPNDDRRDAVIGVVEWRGFYLCRPALVSLPDIEDRLIAADQLVAMPKQPNVQYTPAFGRH